MNLVEFKRALRALVDKSIKDKTPRLKFLYEMKIIANNYFGNEALKREILTAIANEYNFSNLNSVLKSEKEITDELFKSLSPSFAKTKEGIITKVANLVNDGIKENEFSKVIAARLEGVIGTYRNYSDSIVNTALAGYDNLSKHKDDPENALYRYTGAAPQRPFCRLHYGKVYTRNEIRALNNGQGLDVWTYLGGWRCRHHFLLVETR